PQNGPVSERLMRQSALHPMQVGVPYAHAVSATVLPSSQTSLPDASIDESPQRWPVRLSDMVHVALQSVQVAWPYGHSVSVTALPSSQTSAPLIAPLPHNGMEMITSSMAISSWVPLVPGTSASSNAKIMFAALGIERLERSMTTSRAVATHAAPL